MTGTSFFFLLFSNATESDINKGLLRDVCCSPCSWWRVEDKIGKMERTGVFGLVKAYLIRSRRNLDTYRLFLFTQRAQAL
jgi:hypothetical protein